MTTLSTVFALFAVLACALLTWRTFLAKEACDRHAQKLSMLRSRIITMEGNLESLQTQLRKLRGYVYATREITEEEFSEPPAMAPTRPDGSSRDSPGFATVCENYAIAQLEGPKSPEASCECDYCTAMREDRRRARATLLPKTAAGQGELAKRNSGQ